VAKDEKKWAVDPLSLFDQRAKVPLRCSGVKESDCPPHANLTQTLVLGAFFAKIISAEEQVPWPGANFRPRRQLAHPQESAKIQAGALPRHQSLDCFGFVS
jgi:hypothetical protein